MAKRGTLVHPKTKRLARKLGMPPWAALGLLEAFWEWVGRYASTGAFTAQDWEDCADTIGCDVEHLAFLVECGLVDKRAKGYYVHDWHQHADDLVKKNLKAKGQRFANGAELRRQKSDAEGQEETPEQEPEETDSRSIREPFANDSRTIPEKSANDSRSLLSQAKPSQAKPNKPPSPHGENETENAAVVGLEVVEGGDPDPWEKPSLARVVLDTLKEAEAFAGSACQPARIAQVMLDFPDVPDGQWPEVARELRDQAESWGPARRSAKAGNPKDPASSLRRFVQEAVKPRLQGVKPRRDEGTPVSRKSDEPTDVWDQLVVT